MKSIKTTQLLVSICLLISSFAYAQIRISGKVTYENKPVKGVNVTLKDTYDGATTDAQGTFSFDTSEQAKQTIVFSHPNFDDVEKNVELNAASLVVNAQLTEKISEISAVTITAGTIEASDKNRATALLSPIDIYTTAGADGQISAALNYLPGVQKVSGSEGLFIRGGSGSETKIFMDGSLINNYFTKSVPGISGRDRFNTSLFKGNIFSSGGYSALYGQALSGVLILESVDIPAQTSFDVAVSPIFLGGNYQKVDSAQTYSLGGGVLYSNLGLMQKVLNFQSDFTKVPQSFSSNLNFRTKTKSGGMLKYYGSFDTNALQVKNISLEPNFDHTYFGVNGKNTFHTVSYRQKIGKYGLKLSTSYAYDQNDLQIQNEKENLLDSPLKLVTRSNDFNFKAVVERKIGIISAVRGGVETNYSNDQFDIVGHFGNYKNLLTALFAETNLGFSNRFSTTVGVRAENSSYLQKWNVAPRIAFGYRLSKDWITSLAYGIFYQNPESKYLSAAPDNLGFEKAEHYVLQVQKSSGGRTLRMEAFYKKYDDLIKTEGNNYFQVAQNNGGSGFAKGVEVFWRDQKTFKNIDYWISYSYLDTQRDYLNYPQRLVPEFAAKHTLSVVAKKFVLNWKTGFNISYTYASGRPYYDIMTENGENKIRNQGKIKDYSSLNFSMNYLPNLGKSNTVFVLSISNILGTDNLAGYSFSRDGTRKFAMQAPIRTFVFVGAFFSFGADKTQDAINNNL